MSTELATTFIDTPQLDELEKKLKTVEEILDDLQVSTLTESELDELDIPPRSPLLGDWFHECDLGYIVAKRGIGKTWLALHMARALAEGSACGPWKAHKAVKVLYIDGEMPLDSMRKRNQSLREQVNDNLVILSHQRLFDKTEKNLTLSDPQVQEAITQLCEKNNISVIFLDNLSTLFTSIRENSADDWRDGVEGWLLNLRRRKIAVVVVAHAGRNGEMRGTSKREDPAFWQIVLDPSEKKENGAQFITRFTKNRGAESDPPPFHWEFKPDSNRVVVTFREADPLDILKELVGLGLTSCSDIAQEMGTSKTTVSRLAAKAKEAGWLEVKGRGYKLKDPEDEVM